jgi:hypothetical protein
MAITSLSGNRRFWLRQGTAAAAALGARFRSVRMAITSAHDNLFFEFVLSPPAGTATVLLPAQTNNAADGPSTGPYAGVPA